MVRVNESAIIDHPIDHVWQVLRDFNDHFNWHPLVKNSHIKNGLMPDRVGAVRDFTLVSGERVCERLLKLSDSKHTFSYAITASDLPLQNYVAHVELLPVTEGNKTFWRWWSRFAAPEGQEEELRELVANNVYRGGFDGTRRYLKEISTGISTERSDQATLLSTATQPDTTPTETAPFAAGVKQQDDMQGQGVIADAYGDASVLHATTVISPPPKADEVRLQQHAIGVNYIDVYTRSGYFEMIQPPAVPGMEAAATVVDTGAGVTHLQKGDRVCYACAPPGAYASIRTMPAELVMPIPDNIDFETAAAVTLKGVTAYFLTHKVHKVRTGERVLIFAPAGGVGRLLVQWASHLGAEVIGATSSDAKANMAKLAGAHHVITPGQQSLEDQVRELTDGEGVDVVFDAVGRDSFVHSMAALKNCGHLVSFGQASGDIGQHDIGAMAASSLTLSRPNYGHYTDTREKMSEAMDAVWSALTDGVISCEIGQRYPLESAAQAHEALETRQTHGSTLLIPESL